MQFLQFFSATKTCPSHHHRLLEAALVLQMEFFQNGQEISG